MSNYALDLSYLEEFTGDGKKDKHDIVTILMQLDPRANNGQVTQEYRGGLIDVRKLAIEVATAIINVKDIGMNVGVSRTFPYLGKQETLWTIKTEDGSTLLDHRRVKDDDVCYEVIGPNERILGKIWLDIPYRTPYGDIREITEDYRKVPFLNLDSDSEFAQTAYDLWRAAQIDIQKI